MGNIGTKDQEALWRKKQEYYDKIVSETEHPKNTAVFERHNSSKMENMLASGESRSSMASERSNGSRRTEGRDEFLQQSGCLS